jgi:hypothetical protein
MNREGKGKKDRLVILCVVLSPYSGRNSVVSMATLYGLDVSAIDSPLGQDFPYRCRLAALSTQTPLSGVPGVSQW